MSHNTSAVNFTVPLIPVKTGSVQWRAQYKTSWDDSWTYVNLPATATTSDDVITAYTKIRYFGAISSRQNIEIKKDHYYEVKIALISEDKTKQPLGLFWTVQNNDVFDLVTIEQNVIQSLPTYVNSTTASTNDQEPFYNGQYQLYTVTLRAKQDTTGPILIGNTNSIMIEIMPPRSGTGNEPLKFRLAPISTYAEYEMAPESKTDEAAEKELEGTSNIENQTPENTGGSSSENEQTTSIIGTISSFVSAFSNITPSQNCEMDLPFPDFVGGNQRVNICQGKDKAPDIITIASSLLLIVTFVPVAFIVLSMIYREIRSFTNG